jgi:uncharacterized protein YrrD
LRKSRDVIGLPVIAKTGKVLGTAVDLLFDEAQRLRGVLLDGGGIFKRRKYVPAERIRSIGRDAVMVDSEGDVLPLDHQAGQWIGLESGDRKLGGKTVLLAGGIEAGSVTGVYFQEEVGILIGYELSDGWFGDLREGRKALMSEKPLIWGEDVLVAPDAGVELRDA